MSGPKNAPTITQVLAGHTHAFGVFEDRFGRLRRRFTIDMQGSWAGETFQLDERYAYDDGAIETRTWRVVPAADGSFTGTTADCVGTARGRSEGEASFMRYKFRLEVGGRRMVFDFDDRLYPVSGRCAVNRIRVSKWGVRVGEVSLFIEPA